MSEPDDNQPVLTEEEIEALVDHAVEEEVSMTASWSHDFGAGEALTLAKWSELDGLLRAHAEVLEALLLRNFGQPATVQPFAPLFARVSDLLPAMPERLALVSTEIKPLEGESSGTAGLAAVVPGQPVFRRRPRCHPQAGWQGNPQRAAPG